MDEAELSFAAQFLDGQKGKAKFNTGIFELIRLGKLLDAINIGFYEKKGKFGKFQVTHFEEMKE